jgi:hypothetical protein
VNQKYAYLAICSYSVSGVSKVMHLKEAIANLMCGVSPVISMRLLRVLKKNVFREVFPDQSNQRSCSRERPIKEGEMLGAAGGAESDTETVRERAQVQRAKTFKKHVSILGKKRMLLSVCSATYKDEGEEGRVTLIHLD